MAFRVVDRYVYREMAPVFVLATGLFTFLHVMDRMQDFSNMAASGAPFGLVLRQWGLLVLSFLSHALPMGLLMAVLIAAGRLASDLEVVALGASGVSPLRLFRPFAIASVAVALLIAMQTLWINPWGSAEFFRGLHELRRHTAMPMIQERTFTRIGDLVVYAEEVDLATSELRAVLLADERNPKAIGIITAPRGRLIDDTERERTMLRLADGAVHESRPESPDWYRVTKFDVYETPLQMAAQIAEVEERAGPQKKLNTWDLLLNTRALDVSRRAEKAEMFVVEIHKRLALPLAPIVFAMVAFPLGIRLHRGGRAVAAVGGIIVYLAHHIAQEVLGRVTVLRPWGGGRWVPLILFALLGVVLLYFTIHPVPVAWRRRGARLLDLVSELSPFRLRWTRSRGAARRRHRQSAVIDRYLARQFLVYFAYGAGVATAIFVVVDLLETLTRYEPPLGAILEHFAYRLPAAVHQALPFIVLTATVFLFMELQRHHELTALKAAGLSVHRISVPVLVLAGAVSVAAFVFQETAAPILNAKGDEVDRVEIRRKKSAPQAQPQQHWYRRSDSEFARVDRPDRARRLVNGVTLVEIDPNFRVVKRLDAGQAVWTTAGLEFGRSVLREFGPANTISTVWQSGASMRVTDALEALAALPTPPSAMTFMELRTYIRGLRERGQAVGTQVLHLHTKLSFPLMSLVLALLAISCTARWRRGGRLVGGAIAVVITIAYWVVNSGALSLGRVDLLPPIVAAWTANIIFGGIGVSLFVRTPT